MLYKGRMVRRAGRSLLLAPAFFALVLLASASRDARAGFPPPPGATQEQLKDPANWPNDPSYGPTDDKGKPSITGHGGLWQYWSWIPPHPTDRPYRAGEVATGMSVDVAWTYTIGDPRVKIAVLDSGIQWEDRDLVHKAALNEKELANAKPLDLDGKPCGGDGDLAGFDCNKDGAFDLYDYEVSKKTSAGIDVHDANGNGVIDPGDLIMLFSDGKDDDGNGYVDDICGWDFFKDDNDPYDDTRYGHGTGEANDSAAEGSNGIGGLGVCPKCRFVPLRVGDSFITDVDDFGQAAIYAVDNGAKVIQEALGTVNQSRFSRTAIDYAYGKGVVVIASAADENSRHHNMPGTANHTVVVHAIEKDRDEPSLSHTYLNFHPCSNFGGQAVLSASGSGCASEATGRSAGIAGLLYSMAVQRKLTPDLSAEEARQLMMMNADLINVPESYDPTNKDYDPTTYYPSKPTFSQRFGYGRQNVGKGVKAISEGRIPPEVDLTKPEWFEVIYPAKNAGADVPLKGQISAKRATTYDGVIEWAPGVEPDEDQWKTVSTIAPQPGPTVLGADGAPLGFLKVKDIGKIDNPGEKENRYTITVRIKITAHYAGGIGDVKGETRKTLYIYDDPTLVEGFPKYMGTSGEGSPRLHDFDGDGKREILYPTADGELHMMKADGSEPKGWPFKTRRIDGLQADAEGSPYVAHYLGGKNAYTDKSIDPDLAREGILTAPAIGDIDGDKKEDIVFGTYSGTIYAVHADGTIVSGYPIRLPDVPSCPRGDLLAKSPLPAGVECSDTQHGLARGAFPGMTLVDMNKDGVLDVVCAAFDGKVYVFDGKGKDLPGFPVRVHYDYKGGFDYASCTDGSKCSADGKCADGHECGLFGRILTTPAVGDMNDDGIPEIAVGSDQYLGKSGAFGPFFVIDGRGNAAPGGPYLPGWPVVVSSFKLFPLIGEGVVSAGMMADVDGDGKPEVIFHGTGSVPVVLGPKPEVPPVAGGRFPNAKMELDPQFGRLYESPAGLAGNNFIGVFSQPSVADMDQDGRPDIIALGASFSLALALSANERREYEQQVAFWNTADVRTCSDVRAGDPDRKCHFMFPGSPAITEDYTFFHNGTVADVSGDGYPEVIVGTGGYYVRAFDACGREAKGFPKFTGQWIIPSVAVGDMDGDGTLEAVTGTRDGWLYAWHTEGREDGVIEWPTHHHDEQNTGNYATPLGFPKRAKPATPLDLSQCTKATAPPTEPNGAEASGGGACGCSMPGESSSTRGALAGLLVAGLLVRKRKTPPG
jgi:MYXO-CTERM domain-containing protein